jgi:riboflavin kinase/FMN adenylyltransferase
MREEISRITHHAMKLIHAADELGNGSRKVCLAIGVFDGVHLGHQQIIRQTVADARQHDAVALVVTFDRHPNAIVAPERVPPQIYSRSQKLRAIQELGADALLEIPFDRAFSEKTGESFIRELARDLGRIFSICVGANFVFGHRRSGDVQLLRRLGAETGFQVHGHAAVELDGQLVSSTRIREAIRTGDLDAAGQMLGRPYAICGQVLAGDQIGRQLGFPTANLDVSHLVLPPGGVYAACATVNGTVYQAALNIGTRPTVSGNRPQLRVEAHLLDFAGNLYGAELEVQIGSKLREERKFSSPAELKEQIALDVAAVRAAA